MRDKGVVDAPHRRVEAARTSHALEALPASAWTVVRDLQWPGGRYGNVDHVVLGPSGVYVIETLPWSGDIGVYGGHLRHEGRTEDAVVATLSEAAAAVALLTPGVPQRLVKPVLCVTGAEELDTHMGGLLVCSVDRLASMLEARAHSMSTHQLALSSEQLRGRLHDRSVLKVAARAGHTETAKREFVPMKSVPVIRIAIACWFAATLVLAPHVFTDTYDTIHDTVQDTVEQQTDKR